jgi:hypothetical protein
MFLASQRRTPLSAPLEPAPTLRGDGSIAASRVAQEDRSCDVDYRPWTAPHGVTKTFLEAFRPVFIRKPFTNLSYLVKFWEREGNEWKFSEALAEMFGNFRKLSESFSEEMDGSAGGAGFKSERAPAGKHGSRACGQGRDPGPSWRAMSSGQAFPAD